MSACGSPLSSNRRIEPAVAVKASVRPGSSSTCFVVESGGSLWSSAAAGDGEPPDRAPPFVGGVPASEGAAACSPCGDTSSARTPTMEMVSNAIDSRARIHAVNGMALLAFLGEPAGITQAPYQVRTPRQNE